MKKLLICILSIGATIAYSDPIDESLMTTAYVEGLAVYTGCIKTPPSSLPQIIACTELYTQYVATLQVINAPFPLMPTTSPSLYSKSPYDICKFETSHFVFPIEKITPICPALPIL